MTRPLDALPYRPATSRLLVTLVVDTSSSMRENDHIGELNRALSNWRTELMRDDHVRRYGEIALITFGDGHVQAVDPTGRSTGPATTPYVPVSQFSPPPLRAGGVTPMVEGLQYALELLNARRQKLRRDGIPLVSRPLVYLITDGAPTDARGHRSDRWRDLAPVLRRQEDGKRLLFFAFGLAGAEVEVLSGLAPSSWWLLADTSFAEVLTFVSATIESAASVRAQPAEMVYEQVNMRLKKESRMANVLRGNETTAPTIGGGGVEVSPAGPRFVKTVVRRVDNQALVRFGEQLVEQVAYRLGIGIGPRDRDSLLTGDASFPDELLPQRGRRLELFVRTGERDQSGYLYLPAVGPAFACSESDRLPAGTDWDALPHNDCARTHAELAEFGLPHGQVGEVIGVEVIIYVGAAAVHRQDIQLSVHSGPGASAAVTYRLVRDFDDLPDLTDRRASIVESTEHLTINGLGTNDSGVGTFGFELSTAQWNGAAVAVRTTLTELYFTKTEDNKYRARYSVNVPAGDYRAALRRLASGGRSLFNKLFPTAGSRALAPLLRHEAQVRGRAPVVQIARTAHRPFVVPWQVVYDLPMEHPELGVWSCPSVDEYGPGGMGTMPPPSCCPYLHEHGQGAGPGRAILCPYGFWGLAQVLEVPQPPYNRSVDQVVTSQPASPAVVAGTGTRLEPKALATHLTTLAKRVSGFPANAMNQADQVLTALGPADMDIVYVIGHAERVGESKQSTALVFQDRSLTDEDIAVWARDVWRDHWLDRHPLVVLNACDTVEMVQSTMAGFVPNFVNAGASGVVGTETLIEQASASAAMEYFLTEFSAGNTVGEAIRRMRWKMLGHGNLLGFAYTPYCAAGLRLRANRKVESP